MSTETAKQIDRTLAELADRLDELDNDDIDLEPADGKLQIGFDDGTRFIVSRQGATDQIWVAEPNGGWHFNWRDGRWICDKRGVELFDSLSTLIAGKLGEPVRL